MAENPFDIHLQSTEPGASETDADPSRKRVKKPPVPSNPFDAILDLSAERDGTATPEQQAQPKDLFDPALIARIDETIQRHDALAQRGARGANADIWDIITGAARVGREFGGLIDKAVKEHAAGSGFLAAYILTKRGADYLFKKFGGTPEGAMDVIERQTRRLGDIERSKRDAIPAPKDFGEKVSQGIGALPGDVGTFMAGFGAGGPVGWAALKATQRMADPDAGPVQAADAAAWGLAEGAFFKLLEGLVPAAPKKPEPWSLEELKDIHAERSAAYRQNYVELQEQERAFEKIASPFLGNRGAKVSPGPMIGPQQAKELRAELFQKRMETEVARHEAEDAARRADALLGRPPANDKLNIDFEPPQREPSLLNPIERAYMAVFRDFYPLEKAGRKLGDKEILEITRTNGNAGHAKTFLETGGFHPETLKETGNPGFGKIVEKIPQRQWPAIEEYMVAKRTIEKHAQGIETGQPIEAARRIAEAGDKTPWKETADKLYAFQRDVLHYTRDSGLISEEATAAIEAQNQFYVPAFRAGKAEISTGGRAGQPNQPIKKMEGSERPWKSPFRQIVRQTVRLINESDKNRLARTLTRHAGEPGAEKLIVRPRSQPARKTTTTLEDLEGLTENLQTGVGEAAPEQASKIGAPSNFVKFRVFEQGKPTEYFIDPDIANAFGRYGFKQGDKFLDNIVMQALSTPAKIMRAGTTDSPGFFLVKNPARDALTMLFQSKAGAKPGIALVDGLMTYVGRTASYRGWIRAGGAQSTLVEMDMPALRGVVRDMLSERQTPWWREVGALVMTPLRWLQELSKAVESAPRLGEWNQGMRNIARTGKVESFPMQSVIPTGDIFRRGAVARGMEKATGSQMRQAAVASRDVTTDFGIRGSSDIVRMWTKLVPFSNAGLQGLDRFVRLHIENPAKAAALGTMYLTVPSLVIHYRQMQDPEYREKYRRLPNWRKVFFWNFDSRLLAEDNPTRQLAESKFNGIIPTPIPFEWGLIYKATPEAMLTAYMLEDPEVLKDLAENIANQIQPFGTIGDKGIPLPGGKGFMPDFGTSISPFLDIRANQSSFFGTPIETEQERGLPSTMRFDENTTRSAVILSEWMRGLYSPKQTQYLLQSWGGSMARSGMEAIDRALPAGPFGDIPKLKPLANDPVMDFAFGGIAPRSVEEGSSQVVSDFYRAYSQVKQTQAGRAERIKRREIDKAVKELPVQPNELVREQMISQTYGQIQPLQQKKRQVVREPLLTKKEKERQIKVYNRMIDDLASIALGKPLFREKQR